MMYRIAIDGLLSEFAGGEAVLLDLTRKRYHQLNETAGFLWTVLEKAPASPEALADSLVEKYQIEPERATATAQRFAAELMTLGLVEAGS